MILSNGTCVRITVKLGKSPDITFGEYEKDLEEIRKHAFDNGDKTSMFVIECPGN